MLLDQWANWQSSERKHQLCHRSISDIHGGFAIDAYAKEVNTNESGAAENKSYRKRERTCEDANRK